MLPRVTWPLLKLLVYVQYSRTQRSRELKVNKLESSHSPQVPPLRQCCSPGGVTIFVLPAVPLCPLWRNGNENFKVMQNAGFLPDHPQNWITCSLCHVRHSLKISERSVHNFLSYLANTDRQTNKPTLAKNNLLSGGKKRVANFRSALRLFPTEFLQTVAIFRRACSYFFRN